MGTRTNSNASSEITAEAKQWTECLEKFKYAVDSMYEICRVNQTVSGCREALLYLRNASHDFESLIGMINVEQSWENDPNQKQQSLTWEVKATSNALKNFRMTPECGETEGSWHVVENRRRKNTNSSEDESGDEKNEKEHKKTSIYERLAYNLPRPVRPTSPNEMTLSDSAGTNLMCPRSAMDLPQTKASMAKMAYSRERLWKGQIKPLLEERFQRRHQQAANGINRRPTYSQVAKGGSSEKSDSDKNRSREPSLASISETAEEDDNLSTVTMAELGQPTTSSNAKSVKINQSEKQIIFDDIRQSIITADSLMVELEGDDEWKSITAEEESLAQEEESLQKEIMEEERSSIDDEFEREANKRFGKTPTRYKKSWKEVVENWSPIPSPTELSNDTNNSHYLKVNSSDMVYRKPGEVAQVHEKLSSPSRRRPSSDFEKRLSEKQQKAYELRQKLLEEKAQRLKELHQKVTEVKVRKENVALKKRNLLSEKMIKACENRERNLAEVVKKAKNDDFRIHEVQLINTLEAMYLKCDMDSKDQMRREKLQNLAEIQEKKKQKQAAKHAQVEENRMAQQMKQQEKLLEKSEKMEARIQNAADQRNQILEETRQKQRKLTAKIERLKEEESKSTQILVEKLQNKLTKAEKMHEEGLENVKMKAIENITAREMNGNQMIFRMNELDEEMTRKKCLTCQVKILGYHHAIAHICSTTHLANRKLLDKPMTFDLVRNESENVIAELKEKEELRNILGATGIPNFDANLMKKRRSKLKQRLLKENIELKLVPDMMDKNVYKLIKEMETGMTNMAKSKIATDSTRMALEKVFIEMDKTIFVGSETVDGKLVVKIFNSGILKSAFNFLALPIFHEKSVPVYLKRLFLKCSAFVQAVLIPTSNSVIAFSSDYLTDVVELINLTSQKYLQNSIEYEQTMACLAMLSRFCTDSLKTDVKERLTILITYMASHNFSEVVKQFFKELHSSSIPDRLQMSANVQICITNSICRLITFFSFMAGDLKNPKEELEVLLIMFFHFAVNKIRTTFLICDNDYETTHHSPNEELVIRNLFSCLIDAIPRIAKNPSSFGLLKRALLAEDGTVGMHLILLLIAVFKEEIKCLSSMKPDPREKIIRLAGYLPLFDLSLGRMCLVGWQSSLLFILTQQLNFYHSATNKWNLIASLVSIVKTDQAALEIFQSNLGISWLLLFLQIWGKLQKLRKVFVKNHHENESETEESVEFKKKGTKIQGSRYYKPIEKETECVEVQEDSKFNLSGLRRRLEEPPFLCELSGQTGIISGPIPMFQNGKSPPEFEPERPPRPIPPRPEIVEDEEDSDEAASVSSEERAPIVVPIPPRALLPLMDPTQLLRLPHHFALREKFAEVFSAEEISGVPLQRLLEVRRYIQSITNVDSFFDAIPIAHLTHLSINIVDTILHLVDDLDEVNDTILKHVRQYLNFLFTCGNKSAKFRSTFEKHSAFHWLGMLRFTPIKNDIIYSLNFFTDTLVMLYSDDNFILWLVDVIGCFVGFHDNADQRQYIIAYVMKLAELYPCFLYRCHENMSRTNFDDLLLALEKGIKTCSKWENNMGEYGGPPLLKSAVYYLIKFFDMSIDDFNDETLDWHFLFSRIISLMDSISYVIKNISCYRIIFREVPALMHHICQLQNIIVTGDEILKENRLLHNNQQQVVRRQGITANRPFPSRKTFAISGFPSDERVDEDNGNVARTKMVTHDGPPERKYARRSIEHELMENHPLTSTLVFPLPSVEIMEFDVNTGFRSRDSLLTLYRTRRISPVYIINFKKAILRLIGSLCVAVPEYKDITSEYGIVDSTFKSTKVGDNVKGDYLAIARSTLVEICTNHEKNLQSLKDIEPSPSHLLAKHDVIDRLMIVNGDSH